MPKFQQTRINETLAEIVQMEANGQLQYGSHAISDGLRTLLTALSPVDRNLLNEGLKRGDYTNSGPGITAWGAQHAQINTARTNEKKERALHRALLMTLALKSTQPFAAAVQTAIGLVLGMRNAVGAPGSDQRVAELKSRLQHEVHDLNAALGMVQQMVMEQGFTGWDTTKYRAPLRPGCAIGQRGTNGPGTLGCFVRDAAGSIYILSNLHVLKQAGVGLGDAEILQPAHLTGGSYTDVVADYVDGEPLLDASIARVRAGIQVTQELPGPTGFTISGTTQAYQWQLVKKLGCATGFRRGEISRALPYVQPMPRPGFTVLNNAIEITRDGNLDTVDLGFQLQGDSGTILCDLQGRVIALMSLGGGSKQQTGIAVLIDPILQRFNVTILGPGLHTAM